MGRPLVSFLQKKTKTKTPRKTAQMKRKTGKTGKNKKMKTGKMRNTAQMKRKAGKTGKTAGKTGRCRRRGGRSLTQGYEAGPDFTTYLSDGVMERDQIAYFL